MRHHKWINYKVAAACNIIFRTLLLSHNTKACRSTSLPLPLLFTSNNTKSLRTFVCAHVKGLTYKKGVNLCTILLQLWNLYDRLHEIIVKENISFWSCDEFSFAAVGLNVSDFFFEFNILSSIIKIITLTLIKLSFNELKFQFTKRVSFENFIM